MAAGAQAPGQLLDDGRTINCAVPGLDVLLGAGAAFAWGSASDVASVAVSVNGGADWTPPHAYAVLQYVGSTELELQLPLVKVQRVWAVRGQADPRLSLPLDPAGATLLAALGPARVAMRCRFDGLDVTPATLDLLGERLRCKSGAAGKRGCVRAKSWRSS